MATHKLNVNGKEVSVEASDEMPLLWALRDLLQLTGTKFGCGIGACSACAVLIDGKSAQSCQITVKNATDKKVTTIEGIAQGDVLTAVQKAWIEHDVPQCGYCQAGQIIEAVSLLSTNPHPTDEDIDNAFKGHICRCGTYARIKEAVKAAGGAK